MDQKPPANPQGAAPATPLARPLRSDRLLVVDDNDLNRELASELLADEGFRVDVAVNGEMAVRMAAATEYALIFMDMQMPVMDGLEATRAIRQLAGRATVPIVAMTGNVWPEDRERCLAAGMNDFITKPFDPADLMAVLTRWIGPRAATDR